MIFTINKDNFHNLYDNLMREASSLEKKKKKVLKIKLTSKVKELPNLSSLIPSLCKIFDMEAFFEIWVYNIPLCLFPFGARDHVIFDRKYKGEKLSECDNCRYTKRCKGFPKNYFNEHGNKEVSSVKNVPIELMLEIESKCNFNCSFCFNKISFADKGRHIGKEFSTANVKKIIDSANRAGVKIFRFTGGEPLLRKDLFPLIAYAKNKGLETRLNTNGSLIDLKVADKISNLVDNVLIPIDSWSNKKEEIITGYKNALKKKIKAIKILGEKNIPIIRVGTVAGKANVINFDKMAKLILDLPIDEWEWYRPINQKYFKRQDLQILVDKIYSWQERTDKMIFIANAVPFCAVKDKNKINTVSCGALFDDGHNRLVVDPRGFVKPHYFLNENMGDPFDIANCWNHPFMKKMRNLEFLPKQCKNCLFRFKCCGGSRYEAKSMNGDYYQLDPLAKPSKYSKMNYQEKEKESNYMKNKKKSVKKINPKSETGQLSAIKELKKITDKDSFLITITVFDKNKPLNKELTTYISTNNFPYSEMEGTKEAIANLIDEVKVE